METSLLNGRYRILRQIGAGGFGFTFLGEDLGFPHHPKCVVKYLRPQARDAASLQLAGGLFQQEAAMLYRLGRHPNIPALIAHFIDRGEFFLVQEFIEGHPLDREFLGGKRYNQLEAIQLLGQILETLSFVHSEKVIHRDVKPANIIRRASDASVALIDFGAVKQVNSTNADQSVAIGSRGYMPVEQLAGMPNFSSDLFALGLVVIEGLTGLKPLEIPKDPNSQEFLWSGRVALAPNVERFITKLVRREARDRFVSAREALAALDPIAAGVGFFNGRRAVSIPVGPVVDLPLMPERRPEIPQTVIVSPQHRIVRPRSLEPSSVASAGNNDRGSVAKIALGFGGVAAFFAVLQLINFGARQDHAPQPRRAATESAPTPARAQSPTVDVYREALDQANEASRKETNATTKFEWDEIANKYRRAYLLMSSVEEDHPEYAEARKLVDFYRKESERARSRSNGFATD